MSAMPGHVSRTAWFTMMDAQWGKFGGPQKFYGDYKAPDEKLIPLLDKAVTEGVITQAVRDHVVNHWLNAYWPTVDAREVLQRGLYWAMRVALYVDGDPDQDRAAVLPVSCVWICTSAWGSDYPGGETPRFEVCVTESNFQVTVLFMTPVPEKIVTPPEGPFQKVWSIRNETFPAGAGEKQIEAWQHTVTVRPYDGSI